MWEEEGKEEKTSTRTLQELTGGVGGKRQQEDTTVGQWATARATCITFDEQYFSVIFVLLLLSVVVPVVIVAVVYFFPFSLLLSPSLSFFSLGPATAAGRGRRGVQ